jgi:very-short-patch-repair endonuclease
VLRALAGSMLPFMSDLYDDPAHRVDTARRHGMREIAGRGELRARGYSDRALNWRRRKGRTVCPYRGTYLAGKARADLLERLAALRLVLPPEALIAFHTAAALHGFGVVPSDRIHILVPPGINVPCIRGVAAHQSVLPWPEAVEAHGVRCVPAARCAVDLARTLRRHHALPVLDAAIRSAASFRDELASVRDGLVAEVARHAGLRGVRQARELVNLADGRAQCRQESQLRLVLHDAGLPVPEPQLPVRDEYGFERYILDLGYAEERVGVEYDGPSHLDRRRLRVDRAPHNWLAERGWAMRYFTDEDLYRRPDVIVQTVQAALESRRSRRNVHGF